MIVQGGGAGGGMGGKCGAGDGNGERMNSPQQRRKVSPHRRGDFTCTGAAGAGVSGGWFRDRHGDQRRCGSAERLKSPQQLLKASRYCCEAARAWRRGRRRYSPRAKRLPLSRGAGGGGWGEGASFGRIGTVRITPNCSSPLSVRQFARGGAEGGARAKRDAVPARSLLSGFNCVVARYRSALATTRPSSASSGRMPRMAARVGAMSTTRTGSSCRPGRKAGP